MKYYSDGINYRLQKVINKFREKETQAVEYLIDIFNDYVDNKQRVSDKDITAKLNELLDDQEFKNEIEKIFMYRANKNKSYLSRLEPPGQQLPKYSKQEQMLDWLYSEYNKVVKQMIKQIIKQYNQMIKEYNATIK